MRIAVTGGAGFIGSTLVERLLRDHEVVIVDNMSSGRKSNISTDAEFVEADIKDKSCLVEAFSDVDVVFHLAANPSVRKFPDDRDVDFEENLEGTKNVLDAAVDTDVEELIFTSSSVVYGEDADIPTPETANLDPISMYGATKAGGEHMVSVYGEIFGLDTTILRLANIVGGRSEKGVTYDFMRKLKADPERLEILGDGRQKKSYLHVSDTVSGIITAWKSEETVFNIGSEDAVSVTHIAEIVAEEMDMEPEFDYTGGRRGWEGDVPEMRLDVSKLKSEGWNPRLKSEDSIRRTVRELL